MTTEQKQLEQFQQENLHELLAVDLSILGRAMLKVRDIRDLESLHKKMERIIFYAQVCEWKPGD